MLQNITSAANMKATVGGCFIICENDHVEYNFI